MEAVLLEIKYFLSYYRFFTISFAFPYIDIIDSIVAEIAKKMVFVCLSLG